MLKLKPSLPLQTLRTDEFLPPVGQWTTIGGLILIGAVGVATMLASVVKYNVAVRAPATIRPVGELQIVQAPIAGTVEQIAVQPNQTVRRGDVIARLDQTQLVAQQQQLQGTMQQLQIQLAQLDMQIQLMQAQIRSESRASDQALAAAAAELSRNQREYREQQVVTQANLAEAEAALELATSEMQRYQQLVASGAVSQLQLEEKQAAVQAATAQVQRARAALNPPDASVTVAQRQIAQETARGQATRATLQREQELLVQNRAALQAQLLQTQQELQQVGSSLANTTLRAHTDGIVFQLNLRNANQVVQAGDRIAEIAPATDQLEIRARVATQDISRVKTGQIAQMRIEACPFPEYGTLSGTVTAVAPDAITPQIAQNQRPETDSSYFEVTIQPQANRLTNQTQQCQLQSGMQAEANIIAQSETFLQFLLRKVRLLANP